MFERVLIANRGEIARRIARTCRELGIATTAVASDVDLDAPHAHAADTVVRIGPAPAVDSYLDIDALLDAAERTGCDAVHPGYGFLAESPAFARAVVDAGLTFIGPSAEVIELMGDKAAAKRRLAAAGVPVVPGEDRDDLDDDALVDAAARVGFPLLVKAVAGGGGKGMRTVHDPAALPVAIAAARREAKAGFGDDRVILERLIARPRHVEIQVFADRHGDVVHLFERECSIQRRHQKVVEEAPSPAVDPALRERMGQAAVTAAAEVGYLGAGTVEFLLDGTTLDEPEPSFAFLEMNTRLQVEHPVTEFITGLDLVAWQLEVAAGRPLPLSQDELAISGHAIEVRLNAEDPVEHLPQTGTITACEVPEAPDVRFDAAVEPGAQVTRYYDPMIAKLIVAGPDRAATVARLAEVLAETSVRGVQTNLALLRAIANSPAFAAGDLTTGFLDDHLPNWTPPAPDRATIDAALAAVVAGAMPSAPPVTAAAGSRDGGGPSRGAAGPWDRLGPVRPVGGGGWPITLQHGGDTAHARIRVRDGACLVVDDAGVRPLPDEVRAEPDASDPHVVWAHGETGTHRFTVAPATRHADVSAPAGRTSFTAPMPGAVLSVEVADGQEVDAGTTLVVVEAMKMEHPVLAPAAGTVRAVHVAPGQAVDGGTLLLEFDPADAAEDPGARDTGP